MQPQMPDDCLNLEDSGTLDLGRLLTQSPPADDATPEIPELPGKKRQGDSRSRELLANPFDAPEKV